MVGGVWVYQAETTHQNMPKQPTLKSWQNDLGRNNHCQNDSCQKRPTVETSSAGCVGPIKNAKMKFPRTAWKTSSLAVPSLFIRLCISLNMGAIAPTPPPKCLLGLYLFFCHFFGYQHAVYLNSNSRHVHRNTTGDR